MSKSSAGYECTIRVWIPASPTNREEMRRATEVVDALEALDFTKLEGIDGAVVEKIDVKTRHVSKRAEKE